MAHPVFLLMSYVRIHALAPILYVSSEGLDRFRRQADGFPFLCSVSRRPPSSVGGASLTIIVSRPSLARTSRSANVSVYKGIKTGEKKMTVK